MKFFLNSLFIVWYLLIANTTFAYTRADTLRGSNGNGRSWWNVTHYNLNVSFDSSMKSIAGWNVISFKVLTTPSDSMQIDLQKPMVLDSVHWHDEPVTFANEGNVYWIKAPFHTLYKGDDEKITLYYHGTPVEATNPPWNGGFVHTTDSLGTPWVAVACQGVGASLWWPCKDYQGDEPDNGIDITYFLPNNLQIVSNGREIDTVIYKGVDGNIIHKSHWKVLNPINTYDVTFYIGDYVHWHDTLTGERGKLDLDYYVLRYNLPKAIKQFQEVKPMLHCFEYWAGPYPFYSDGYKLAEAPYLGMEHQSAVAYGNKYLMGYLGQDRSRTDIGLSFDFIIVHESGHEWFGNSITAKDIADNWIHEGITTYLESLYVECRFGKDKGQEYCRGEWSNIRNDKPVIGDYDVNDEGSSDMYDKGAAVMYMIRKMMNNDEKFRMMLRGLSNTFYHQTVTTQQVEDYISNSSGLNLTAFFNQYLRTADIPELDYYIRKKKLYYRYSNIVNGLNMPLEVNNGNKNNTITVSPTTEWQHVKWRGNVVSFSNDFLYKLKQQ